MQGKLLLNGTSRKSRAFGTAGVKKVTGAERMLVSEALKQLLDGS